MSRVLGVVVAVALGSCVHDTLVDCRDGRACPSGTLCARITQNDQLLCANPADVAACGDPFSTCMRNDGSTGTCYASDAGAVCLPGGCGNAIVDPDEACDDGNVSGGDGCSGSCTSDETCNNGVVDPGLASAEACDDGNTVGHDGCNSTCKTEVPRWELLATGKPPAALSQGVAYDSARRRVVQFGGAFQGTIRVPRGDTWEYDGEGWMKIPTTVAPAARWGSAMAYDPIHRRVVLFGGASTAAAPFGDTWAWDGERWTQLITIGAPPPRADASLVYDPETRRMLLYGGRNATGSFGDGWELDGGTWTQVTHSLPPARAQHAMAYDPKRGVMVLVGDDTTGGETWERHAGTWSSAARSTTDLRGAGLAFDGVGLLVFGAAFGSETYRWDGTAWSPQTPTTSPEPRSFAAMVADPVRGRVLLFGGGKLNTVCTPSCWTVYDSTWEWDGTTWTRVDVVVAEARAWHAATFDTRRGSLFFYGGGETVGGFDPQPELQEFRGTHWTRHAGPGTPLTRAALAYDAARDELVLVGGALDSGGRTSNKTWTWRDGVWTSRSAVPARRDAAIAYDPVRRVVVVFGGANDASVLADTWEWDGTTWREITPTSSPPSRFGAALAWDPVRRTVLLAGGENFDSATQQSDLWSWDGVAWTQIMLQQYAPPRASLGLTWNAPRRSMMMFAGAAITFTLFADTWELGANGWSQITVSAPDVRQGHSLTQLADGTGLLTYGGAISSTVSDQLYRLRWDNDGTDESCALDVDSDGDGLAGCADPDCWARCSPLCPPGTTCEPSWPHCGDGTCDPREDCRLCPMDCACGPVCGDHFCDPGETCTGDCQ
ncbi:MAG: hypothetical protein ACKV2T_15670 [Kofleriaceae bacterium]